MIETSPKERKTPNDWAQDENAIKYLTFASRRAEAKEVDFTALTVLTCDPRLTLTLSTHNVTLTISGANRVAVAPKNQSIREKAPIRKYIWQI